MRIKNGTEWNTADLEALVKATGLNVSELQVSTIRGHGRRQDRMDKLRFYMSTDRLAPDHWIIDLSLPARKRVEDWTTPLERLAQSDGLALPAQMTAWLFRSLKDARQNAHRRSHADSLRGTIQGLPEAPVTLYMPHKRKSKTTPVSLEEAKAKLVTHTTRLLDLDRYFKDRMQALQAEFDKERAKVEKRISIAQKQIDKATRRQERKNARDGLTGIKEGA